MARRLADFLARRPMPFHLWARKTAYERLLNARRDHRADRRDVGREEAAAGPVVGRPGPSGSSPRARPRARRPRPGRRAERVAAAVAGLAEADREVLLMRHVEGLPYEEIACLLGIDPAAARQRYGRALIRLQKALADAGLSRGRVMTDADADVSTARSPAWSPTWRTSSGPGGPAARTRTRRSTPPATRRPPTCSAACSRSSAAAPAARPGLAPRLRLRRAARRLPDRPGGRPGRDGGRVRGRAAVASAGGWR